ncbi:MAG: hypothetical protein JSS58_07340 [Proteobacteria bacterium]|nr:hypothetical protein [Pseudomonadota bacterium]
MKRILHIATLCATFSAILVTGSAHAAMNGSELSGAGSQALSDASGMVVVGTMSMVAGSGEVLVTSVKTVGEASEVVLTKVADGVSTTIRVSGKAAQALSQATGKAVQVVAMSTGHMLVASGKAIAFIPNEIGTALLHHSTYQ